MCRHVGMLSGKQKCKKNEEKLKLPKPTLTFVESTPQGLHQYTPILALINLQRVVPPPSQFHFSILCGKKALAVHRWMFFCLSCSLVLTITNAPWPVMLISELKLVLSLSQSYASYHTPALENANLFFFSQIRAINPFSLFSNTCFMNNGN